MRVEICHEGNAIGHSNLDAFDPPMGVAEGRLEPTTIYDPSKHASDIDGDRNEVGAKTALTARFGEFGEIDYSGVHVEDFSQTLGEIRVSLSGIPHSTFEAMFGSYPSYKAYYEED